VPSSSLCEQLKALGRVRASATPEEIAASYEIAQAEELDRKAHTA
jgi:hypothetical protein